MTKKSIEQRLIASARQALAIKRGELAPSQSYDLPLTARDASAEEAPTFTKDEIATIRESIGLSQALFAKALNVSVGTVRSWEQGVRYPDGAASRLLQVAARNPGALTIYVRERGPYIGRDAVHERKDMGVFHRKGSGAIKKKSGRSGGKRRK
jgi:putative transcriptional regulator